MTIISKPAYLREQYSSFEDAETQDHLHISSDIIYPKITSASLFYYLNLVKKTKTITSIKLQRYLDPSRTFPKFSVHFEDSHTSRRLCCFSEPLPAQYRSTSHISRQQKKKKRKEKEPLTFGVYVQVLSDGLAFSFLLIGGSLEQAGFWEECSS